MAFMMDLSTTCRPGARAGKAGRSESTVGRAGSGLGAWAEQQEPGRAGLRVLGKVLSNEYPRGQRTELGPQSGGQNREWWGSKKS